LRSEGDGHEREDDQRGQPEAQHASECGGRIFKPGCPPHVEDGSLGRPVQTLARTKREHNSDPRVRYRNARLAEATAAIREILLLVHSGRLALGWPDARNHAESGGHRDAPAAQPGPLPVHHPSKATFRPASPPVVTAAGDEGLTLVVPQDDADAAGLAYDDFAGWITLRVNSAPEAVGLTAAVAWALADARLSCNVVAGCHHDHLFVPYDRAAQAVAVLEDLARRPA
jgi:uncharacterized protein